MACLSQWLPCHWVLSPLIDMTEVCVNQKIKQISDLTCVAFITGYMMVVSVTRAVGVSVDFLPEQLLTSSQEEVFGFFLE